MKFPQRIEQHISETKSFKIFSSKIPDNWLVREITERDYGVDCYIELVNNKNELTGKLISIQLKARQEINWNVTEPTKWTLSGIDISSTNYWYHFSVPVFICVVDLESNEVFFQSVKQYIKINFLEYSKQKTFSYKIDRTNKLDGEEGLKKLLKQYFKERDREVFESNIITFFANIGQYNEFYEANIGRDQFMGIEKSRLLFARHFYNNIYFLSKYLEINWDLLSFYEYEKISQSRYGDNYDLYEEQLDEIVTKLKDKIIPITLNLKELITDTERQYWLNTDIKLFNFVANVNDDGTYEDW